MNYDDFDCIVLTRFKKLEKLLLEKSKHYSRNGDRLYSFKRAAQIQRITPEKALLGQFTKHLVSVIGIIENVEEYDKSDLPLICEEKISDAINYLLLLEGLIVERLDK